MNRHYIDILSRIPEAPVWFDEAAVPRYVEFTPRKMANIYADEVALVEIACQNCGREFKVAISFGGLQDLIDGNEPLHKQIRDGSLHYGDPPNVMCCAAGPTMNCMDLRVLEYWHRKDHKWVRDQTLEIELPDAKDQIDDIQ